MLAEGLMYRPGIQIPGLLWTNNSFIRNSTLKWMFAHLKSQLCFQLATCHIRCWLWAISCVNCKQHWVPFGTSNSRFRNVSVKGVRFSPLPRTNHKVYINCKLTVVILWHGWKRLELAKMLYPHIICSAKCTEHLIYLMGWLVLFSSSALSSHWPSSIKYPDPGQHSQDIGWRKNYVSSPWVQSSPYLFPFCISIFLFDTHGK